MTTHRSRIAAKLLLFSSLFALPAVAFAETGLEVRLPATTITDFLSAVMPETIDAPIAGQNVPIKVTRFRVTGFEPRVDGEIKGYVRTALTIQSAELGLALPVAPKLSVRVRDVNGFRICELRFEEVNLTVPFVGSLNLAPMFEPVILPADYLSEVPTGQKKDVPIRTRLRDVVLEAATMRLEFDVIVNPVLPPR